jgi:hypothetical protein
MRGDAIEIGAKLVDRLRPEREAVLAPDAHATDDTGAFEHAQMLGDRLPRQGRAFGQPRDRPGRPARQVSDQGEPRLVTESREGRGAARERGSAFNPRGRHGARY